MRLLNWKYIGVALLSIMTLWLWACSDDGSSSSEEPVFHYELPELPDDMIALRGSKTVILGTNDTSALLRERPALKTELDYDYYLGKHEVTCEEFTRLIKISGIDSSKCGDLPMTNVTYYDAVLYANERSKEEGFDTVYVYSEAWKDGDGHCSMLTGLWNRLIDEGYRLPTEAEWMYAAVKNWNVDDSWHGGNSSGKAHEVCTGKPDADGFCDLSGNVMEWMNGWFGFFNDTTLQNYVGSLNANTLNERLIKGGSFHHDPSAIRYTSRGDVYTVTALTSSNYLGFRLAFGPLFKYTGLASDGSAAASTLKSLADIETIRKLTGAFRAMVAFRNDVSGNLVILNYNVNAEAFIDYKDTVDVYHPEISPNGSKVVFCSMPEGVPGKSSIYVRNISGTGETLLKLDVESGAIPRWRVLPSGDTAIVYVTDAEVNTDSSTWKKKTTWQVTFINDEFGTPEKLYEGSFHGGISDDEKLAVTGARLLRARVGDVDTVWYNGEQACNVALSRDGSKRTAFLDFASATGKDFVGSKYSVHQRLLIADSTGKLIKSVEAPKGYTFDHTEWVSNYKRYDGKDKGFVIASLTDSKDAHSAIALVNLQDSSVTKLIEGDEVWHPNLWIQRIDGLTSSDSGVTVDLDSAAFYVPQSDVPILAHKMNLFWSTADSLDFVGIGSSRMTAGFFPKLIKNKMGINMGSVNVDMHVIDYVARNYVFNHSKKLRYMVIGLDFDLWSEDEDDYLEYNLTPEKPYQYDKNHDFWKDGVPKAFMEINETYIKNLDILTRMTAQRGWVRAEARKWTNGGFNASPLVGDSTWSDKSKNYTENMKVLKSLIEFAKEKNVVIIGVVFPQSPEYKDMGCFGRHGMRRSTAKKILEEIQGWTKDYSNFVVMDENKMGEHDYPDEMAYDYDHLSFLGAKQLSNRVDSLIRAREEK